MTDSVGHPDRAYESYSAAQAGQSIAWGYLQQQGRLPTDAQREWELGANEQHCPTCSELARQRQVVPLDEPFLIVGGAKVWSPRAHSGSACKLRLDAPKDLLAALRAITEPSGY